MPKSCTFTCTCTCSCAQVLSAVSLRGVSGRPLDRSRLMERTAGVCGWQAPAVDLECQKLRAMRDPGTMASGCTYHNNAGVTHTQKLKWLRI